MAAPLSQARPAACWGASAALLLNAIKVLGDIPHNIHLIAPSAIEPIQTLKTQCMEAKPPASHTDEVLIALEHGARPRMKPQKPWHSFRNSGAARSTSVMLSDVDIKGYSSKLGVQLTSEPVYEHKKLYH